jgi:hypothetical protein
VIDNNVAPYLRNWVSSEPQLNSTTKTGGKPSCKPTKPPVLSATGWATNGKWAQRPAQPRVAKLN